MRGLLTTFCALALLATPAVFFLHAAAEQGSFAFQPATDSFQPTVLDCGGFIEAPTGKHGFVTTRGDRFVFQDGTPARFWGAQMNVISRPQLDYTVRRMRRQGINITRLHGLENLNDRNGQTSFDYNQTAWDRMDYLLAKLGENGIYIILDVDYPLNFRFKPGDNIPGLPEGGPAAYAEFFNETVASVLHQRMTDVFTHVNPYTKKRYADDPTIAMVEVLNEDSLFWGTVGQPFRAELEQKFAAWLRGKYHDDAGLRQAWTVDGKWPLAEGQGLGAGQRISLLGNTDFTEKYLAAHPEQKLRGLDQLRFYEELEEAYWTSSRELLRKAGVKVPIAGTNWQAHGFPTRIHMLGQSKFDYVDRHGYWDHPQGEGNLRWNIATAQFHNLPMVKAVKADQDTLVYLGVGNLVTEKAWERVLGMPMTVSEWNTCLPNEYSLEGGGLMAAYGLLQGWDGSLQFGYFSPDFRQSLGSGSFDLFGNPPQILQFPAIAAMWYRQDVKEAKVVAESQYDSTSVYQWTEDRKPVPLWAALVGKVGYRFVSQPRKPVVKDLRKYWDAQSLTARSITGELSWNASAGVIHVDTARTQAVIGFLSAAPHKMAAVSLSSPNRFGAVWVTAMDGLSPIRSARRLLVTAVGPARNTGMEYEQTSQMSRLGAPFWHLKSVGAAPALLEAAVGELRIRSSHARQMKCWALDVVGNRRQRVPVSVEAGELVLGLRAAHQAVYYELAVE
jgi:hypothetical protein